MYAAQLLDEAKTRLSLKSDYALAKASGMSKQRIGAIRAGKEGIPLHFAYWLAITLERDPAHVVAVLEQEREKNAERVAFWTSFLSRAAVLTLTCCTLVLGLFALGGSAQAASGGNNRTGASSDNQRLRRIPLEFSMVMV
jgi:hypothetical protein